MSALRPLSLGGEASRGLGGRGGNGRHGIFTPILDGITGEVVVVGGASI